MGTRNEKGVIVPFPVKLPELGLVERTMDTDTSGTTQELLFTGRAERVPDCVQRLVSLINSPIPFMSSFLLQIHKTAEERDGNLPPTQEVMMYDGCPADTTGSLPPSDIPMQEGSLVTNSDVDTQVIHDLLKGQVDLDRSSGKENLTIL